MHPVALLPALCKFAFNWKKFVLAILKGMLTSYEVTRWHVNEPWVTWYLRHCLVQDVPASQLGMASTWTVHGLLPDIAFLNTFVHTACRQLDQLYKDLASARAKAWHQHRRQGKERRKKKKIDKLAADFVLPSLAAALHCSRWMGGKWIVCTSKAIHLGTNFCLLVNRKIAAWYFLRCARNYEGLFLGSTWKVRETVESPDFSKLLIQIHRSISILNF